MNKSTTTKPVDNLPRYRELLKPLRDQIISGQLKPGDQLPSLSEMRAQHKVSRATVEKVHSLLESEGLIVRQQGRGIFVSGGIRKAHQVIAFSSLEIFEEHLSYYGAQLSSGIGAVAKAENVQLLLVDETVDAASLEKIDGLIVYASSEILNEIQQRLPAGLPCVSVVIPLAGIDCVLVNDYQGTYEATRHLTDLGHRKVAYLIRSHDEVMEKRMQGYSDALQAVGVEPKLAWVKHLKMAFSGKDSSSDFREYGYAAMEQWIKTDWKKLGCTALLAQNDHCAIGAIAALQKAGFRVPEDVSVVGFDGTETYEWFTPRLTTIDVPLYQIGMSAAQILLSKIKGGAKNVECLEQETKLHLGQSSGPPPTAAE